MRTIAFLLLFSATASAQVGTEPLAWAPQNRHIADALGTAAVAAQIGADTLTAWRADDRKHALLVEGCSLGMAFGASQLLKTFIHEERPNGADNQSFPSMHASLGTAASWKRFEFSIPIAAFIGLSRSAANAHHLWPDVAAGWAIGAASQAACRAMVH